MAIVSLTSDGLTIACLFLNHDWSAQLSVSHVFRGTIDAGVSGREGRRPGDEAFRLTAAVHLQLDPAEGTALRQTLATLAEGYVGVPLWNDVLLEADWSTRVYEAERIVDLDSPIILAKDAILTAGRHYAPLLVGHIDELPTITPIDDTHCELSFTVVGDAPWEFRIGINGTASTGLWPSTLVPDWTSSPTDTPEHGLRFDQIGDQRTRTIEGQERAFRWNQEAEFWLTSRTEVRTLLAFFLVSQGQRQPFEQPWWFKPGAATAEAPHSTTVRFANDVVTLDYFTDADATARIKVTQLPWEITGVMGETPVQPARVFLYKITYALPTPVIYRFTSWPRPLTRTSDGTYQPQPFTHRKFTGSTDLRGTQIALDSFLFSGNPLALFHPDIREGRLLLEVREIETDPIDADAAVLKWFGEIKSVRTNGRKLDAAGVFIGQILDRQLPNVLIGPICNTRLFSSRCKLVKAAFDKTGTFAAAADCVLDITTSATDAAGTFAHGSIEIGTGAAWEVRSIVDSTPISGGQRLTVDWPVRQAPVGQAVLFARGCDLQAQTCKDLGNFENFRGHPNRPTVNLSLPTIKPAAAPGKK